MAQIKKAWWKEAVVYQIYPRSFKDSNGDGIGDLKGIISKLDYIEDLGIDVVWLNPIYTSPNDDMGYDIADYQNIMNEFGTMQDFEELLYGLHSRGIKLIMDLVVNHTSNEHEWFIQSSSSRNNPYRDYYHWWPAEKGKPAHRWSFFDKEGSAWKYDSTTDAYYLHYFSEKQPDLNWENPKVRKAIYDMMHFWFQKGIDGFRMDVISFISKDTSFPPISSEYIEKGWDVFYASGPYLHQYLREMNQEVLSHYDIMTVAEGIGISAENILDLVDEDRNELNMSYHFDHTKMGILPRKFIEDKTVDLIAFKKIFTQWDKALAEKGWGTIYLGNHDQPRMVSRWGDDSDEWRSLSSKMLTTFILTMRGTPYYYMGDEIGMNNIKFERIEDYKDIETINWYELIKNEGGDLNQFLDSQKITARDNSRTPMQWEDAPNAGFTNGSPWIAINENYKEINVKTAAMSPNSCLNYFKKLIRLRKENEAFIYGDYHLLDAENPSVYAYTRALGETKFLVLLNFTKNHATVNTGISIENADEIVTNYPNFSNDKNVLRPYEARIYLIS